MNCLLLDVDGVVIESPMFSALFQQVYGTNPEVLNPFFEGVFQDCLVGKADLKQVIAPYLNAWGFNGSPDELLDFWFNAENKPNLELLHLVQVIKNTPNWMVALATNQERYRTQYLTDKMGFKDVFDAIFSSAQVGYKKPDSRFYSHVLQQLNTLHGIKPEFVYFFDDSPANVLAAQAFSVQAFYYTGFEEFKDLIQQILQH